MSEFFSNPLFFIILFAIICVVLCLALAVYVRAVLRSKHEAIGRSFDFDLFKNREIQRRGVHDKTKWD